MIDPIPVDLTDWHALKTPCFVFDEPELRANFDDFAAALRSSWGERSRVAYSVKTNPLWWVLDVAREQGCMAEVVSAEEFDLALRRGFSPDQVVFNGPIKTRDWLEFALDADSYINLDSARDIEWTCQWAALHPGRAHVGVRANIELERFVPGETVTGDDGGRFGYSYENGELANAVATLRSAGVDVCGLHMHVTTRSRATHVYEVLARHAVKIARELHLELAYVDMGGGFFGGGKRNDGAYERYADAMADVLREEFDPQRCELIVEPGGAVVSTPCRYLGRVVDAKDTTVDRFVTCELSRVNIDHEMKKTSYPLHVIAPDGTHKGPGSAVPGSPRLARQVLCGFTCMESDRLCVLEDWPELRDGDLVYIDFAGAYSMSFTPGFFIQGAPAVYARDSLGSTTLLREGSLPSAPAAPSKQQSSEQQSSKRQGR